MTPSHTPRNPLTAPGGLLVLNMTHFTTRDKFTISEDRQRKEFDAARMGELRASILTNSLLHAPVMRTLPDGTLQLVAGETRIKAMEMLHMTGDRFYYAGEEVPEDHFPYINLGELSEVEAEEAELMENLRRTNITWQEETQAWARIHALRSSQRQEAAVAGSAQLSTDSGKPDSSPTASPPPSSKQTLAATAEEIFGSASSTNLSKVSTAVKLQKHLDNPLIAKAKSQRDAIKILEAEERRSKNIAEAAKVGQIVTTDRHMAHNADCITFLEGYTGPKFDCVLTDPIYGIGADQFGDAGGSLITQTHKYDDSYGTWKELMGKFIPLIWQHTKDEAHVYLFCDIERYIELKAMMAKAGFDVHRTPLIDYKVDGNRVPRPEHGPRRQYEIILYAIKGNKKTKQIKSDVIPCRGDKNQDHGAQKPVELFVDLLSRSVDAGDRVADFFAGTGPIVDAAEAMHCYSVSVERDPQHFPKIVKRIQAIFTPEVL